MAQPHQVGPPLLAVFEKDKTTQARVPVLPVAQPHQAGPPLLAVFKKKRCTQARVPVLLERVEEVLEGFRIARQIVATAEIADHFADYIRLARVIPFFKQIVVDVDR